MPSAIEEASQLVLNRLCALSITWKARVEAMQEERHTDAWATVAILAGHTLETGEHMAVPVLPELLDGFSPAGKVQLCPQCQKDYTLAYPGQPYCSNTCADAARGITKVPAVPMLATRDEEEIIRKHTVGTSFKSQIKLK